MQPASHCLVSVMPNPNCKGRKDLARQHAIQRAGLFGVFSAVLVGIVMTYLMPLIQHMPLNALAAIITSGVLGLFDYNEGFHLFRVRQQGPFRSASFSVSHTSLPMRFATCLFNFHPIYYSLMFSVTFAERPCSSLHWHHLLSRMPAEVALKTKAPCFMRRGRGQYVLHASMLIQDYLVKAPPG